MSRNARGSKKIQQPSQEVLKAKVDQVKSVTQWLDEDIIPVLEQCHMDVEEAITNILDGKATNWQIVSKKKPKDVKTEESKQKSKPSQSKGKSHKSNGENKRFEQHEGKKPNRRQNSRRDSKPSQRKEKSAPSKPAPTTSLQAPKKATDNQEKIVEEHEKNIKQDKEVKPLVPSGTPINYADVVKKQHSHGVVAPQQPKPIQTADQTMHVKSVVEQKPSEKLEEHLPSQEHILEVKSLPTETVASTKPEVVTLPPSQVPTAPQAQQIQQHPAPPPSSAPSAPSAVPRTGYHPPGIRAWKPKQDSTSMPQPRTTSANIQPQSNVSTKASSRPSIQPSSQQPRSSPVVTMPPNISSLSSSPVTLPPSATISSNFDDFHFGTIDVPSDTTPNKTSKSLSGESSQTQPKPKAEKKDHRVPVTDESVSMPPYPVMPHGSPFIPSFPFTGYEADVNMRPIPMYPDLLFPPSYRDMSSDSNKYPQGRGAPVRGSTRESQSSQMHSSSSVQQAQASSGPYYSPMVFPHYVQTMSGQFIQNQIPQHSMYRRHPYGHYPNSYPNPPSGTTMNYPEDMPQEFKNNSFAPVTSFPYMHDQNVPNVGSAKNPQSAPQTSSSSKTFNSAAPPQNGNDSPSDLMGNNFKTSQTFQNREIPQQTTGPFPYIPQHMPQGSNNYQLPSQQNEQTQQYQLQS